MEAGEETKEEERGGRTTRNTRTAYKKFNGDDGGGGGGSEAVFAARIAYVGLHNLDVALKIRPLDNNDYDYNDLQELDNTLHDMATILAAMPERIGLLHAVGALPPSGALPAVLSPTPPSVTTSVARLPAWRLDAAKAQRAFSCAPLEDAEPVLHLRPAVRCLQGARRSGTPPARGTPHARAIGGKHLAAHTHKVPWWTLVANVGWPYCKVRIVGPD